MNNLTEPSLTAEAAISTRFIDTGAHYRRIIAADPSERERLFRELLLEPMAPMFAMMPHYSDDPMSVAHQFGYLLPEALDAIPPALAALEAADTFRACDDALALAARHFAPYAERIPVREITGWLILLDPAKADPANRGYSGFQWFTGHLMLSLDTADAYTLPRLPGAAVHELHHIVRLNHFPWDMARTTVADYIVLEGMAESFAAQLFGEGVIGYYADALNAEALSTAKALIREGLAQTGFDVIRGYIFGDELAERWGFARVGMPAYGGYTVGYQVVQAYLRRTGQTVEAATFVPADEIVREAGYFG